MLGELKDWDQVKLLTVTVDRMPRWHRPGLLCIGDAAHAMSPIGGVGINLAVQDAVAAANILWEPLSRGHAGEDDLARVQKRREFPARVTQGIQVFLQNRVISRALQAKGEMDVPLAVRLIARFPLLRRIPARLLGLGVRPEHVRTPDSHRSGKPTLQQTRGTKPSPFASMWQRCGAPKCCGSQQRAGPGAFFQRLAPRRRARRLIEQAKLFQCRMIDLDRVMDHVAAEVGLLALRGRA